MKVAANEATMNDPSKIPIITLAGITSLTDLLHELPLPGPHPGVSNYSLLCHVPPMDARNKQDFATGDSNLASRVANILGAVNTDHLSFNSDVKEAGDTNGVKMLPMLKAVLDVKPDLFLTKPKVVPETLYSSNNLHQNLDERNGNLESNLHQQQQLHQWQLQATANEVAQAALPAHEPPYSTNERLPYQHQKPKAQEEEPQFSVENSTPTTGANGEENQKICIKIRKKKKSTRDSDHGSSGTESVRYGIVDSCAIEKKQVSTGSLKIKISRVKTDEEATSKEATFTVHSEPTEARVPPIHPPPVTPVVPPTMPTHKAHYHKTARRKSSESKTEHRSHKSHSKQQKSRQQAYMDHYRMPQGSGPTKWPENLIQMPPAPPYQNTDVTSAEFIKQTSQHPLKPTDFSAPNPPPPVKKKSNRKKLDHIRVKFIADMEEADIYKLSDIMYPDDTEVEKFEDLEPGTTVVAKWPANGKLYEAMVIDPLEDTGRKFRDRKPPPVPFQVDPSAMGRQKFSAGEPRVVLTKMPSAPSDARVLLTKMTPEELHASQFNPTDDSFQSMYLSMADRIKMKKRAREEEVKRKAKRFKASIEEVDFIDEGEEEDYTNKKHRKDSHKKHERRRLAELRMMEEDSLKRMSHLVDTIFEDIDAAGVTALNFGGNEAVPDCLLVSLPRLNTLASETMRLKSTGMLNQVPTRTLVRLLNILCLNIRSANGIKPMEVDRNLSPDEQRWQKDAAFDRIFAASNASMIAMYVMTTPGMPKAVYIEDVMEQTAQLLRFQLENTIYPEYDQVYKLNNNKKGKDANLSSSKQKRAHYKGTKNITILQLYNRLVNLVSLWAQLLEIQPLTDTTVLKVSSIAISPFFVENVRELQLSALQLTTTLFARYEKHRKIIVEDIFQSLARLPTSKRNLRNFRLNYAAEDQDDETAPYIQMVSALMLQMMHAIVNIKLEDLEQDEEEEEKRKDPAVNELSLLSTYDTSTRTAQAFLFAFLRKCSGKNEDIDFRPIFEHFIHDLLATVNKPEWPAAEMMLSFLGQLLVRTFSNRSNEVSLRVVAIDYLGAIAAKLRRDVITSQLDVSLIHKIIQEAEHIPANESADNEKPKKKKDQSPDIRKLYKILLHFIQRSSEADSALMFAHNFYIGQWLRDISREILQQQQKADDEDDTKINKQVQKLSKNKDAVLRLATEFAVEEEARRERIANDEPNSNALTGINKSQYGSTLTYDQATLITRYMASARPFTHSFDIYLTHILRVSEESAVAVRTRAIKCLAEIVAVDPNILSREDIWCGVKVTLMDQSTSVREASIDLIGRFILLKPELVPKYYDMLTARIMDTGVSVRKRVIKILRDLCYEYPMLPQLTDACVKIISRINDEDGIKKLVHEVFMRMWFSPLPENADVRLNKKAASICDVVASNNEFGYNRIEQMMRNLIDSNEAAKEGVELACKQVVNCLVENIIKIEQQSKEEKEKQADKEEKPQDSDVDSDEEKPEEKIPKEEEKQKEGEDNPYTNSVLSTGAYHKRISAVMRTMVLFTKIRPKLMVEHVGTLQPYVATKCKDSAEMMTEKCVCKILELAVPLMEHPGDTFLASLEEDLMKIILRDPLPVVQSAIACLGAITKHVTKNYKLVWDCCQKIFRILNNIRAAHQKKGDSVFSQGLLVVKRTLFITGQLMRTFDFDDKQLKGDIQISVKKQVYNCMQYFTQLQGSQNVEIRSFAVSALGLLMVQDPSMMFEEETKNCYMDMLRLDQEYEVLTKQVLLNIRLYLQEEVVLTEDHTHEAQQHAMEKHKAHLALDQEEKKFEDIKEINDVSSGMASSVTLVYLKQILASFFHRHAMVRSAALETVRLILEQGLVSPPQCIPHVIAMSSDPSNQLSGIADQQLSEVNKNYSLCIRRSAMQGLRMSYQLQQCIHPRNHVIRGWKNSKNPDEASTSIRANCAHLYSLIRNDKKHRRTLMLNLLHLFDDTVKSDLGLLLFMADNLASFPYATSDEPLYLMCQIEVYASVSGGNVLQTFTDALKKKKKKKKAKTEDTDPEKGNSETTDQEKDELAPVTTTEESEEEESDFSDLEDADANELESRIPHNDSVLIEFMETSLACSLLLEVKQHLKLVFGFTDAKIQRYSPSESGRGYEKQCNRKRANVVFNPTQVCKYRTMKLNNKIPQNPANDEKFRAMVAEQYIQFNELMRKIDPCDENSDSDKEMKTPRKSNENKTRTVSETKHEEPEDSDRDSDTEPSKPSHIQVASRSGQTKHKKKLKEASGAQFSVITEEDFAPLKELRSRKKVQYIEDDSLNDSEEDFLGF